MTEDQAFIILKQIEEICNKYSLWVKIEWDKKPVLKWVTATITIKVDNN